MKIPIGITMLIFVEKQGNFARFLNDWLNEMRKIQ